MFFSYDFPPLEGGISRLCSEMVLQLKKQFLDVIILSSKSVATAFDDKEFDVDRVPQKRIIREVIAWGKLFFMPKNSLVVTGKWYPEGVIALLAGHKKLIVIAHGGELLFGKKKVKNVIMHWLRKYVIKRSQLIICNSNYTQSVVTNHVETARTCVCNLGVDVLRFCPSENKQIHRNKFNLPSAKKIVLSVSRIEKHKGHDVVLGALAHLGVEEQSQIVYCIAGRGPYVAQLKKQAKELGVESCIEWLGFVEECDLVELYQAADLFTLCSREEKECRSVEGFGLVFLEAQACAIPVLGTNQGGIPDAISHGNGGWIVEKDDSKGVAKYLKKLCSEPNVFIQEGIKARNRVVNEATWSHFSERAINEINNVVGEYE